MHFDILFELGIVLFFGFFTAIIMKRLRQSVIAGYMIAGLLIGPNVFGLIKDPGLVDTLAEMGIVLLMFFLGLEFSVAKFKRVKNSVLFIGTYKILFNIITGLFLGSILGLLFKERLYLAGIIALSSSGVVAKLLFEQRKTASSESEVLMGVMVYEDFIAIVLLGILSSLAAFSTIQLGVIAGSILKSFAFYAVFILLGIFLINKFTDKILMRIESQELFTALILSLILLSSSLAVKIGLASAAGAFLLGMLINSYDVEERLHHTVSAFKDIFLIVFFISFGMLLDPRRIPGILPLAALIIPVSFIAEMVFTSSAAFFSGFSAAKAISIGSSTIARGEYSMIFATLGYTSGALSENLYQFTGVYVFVMTLLAPVTMKNSLYIGKVFAGLIPKFIKYAAKLVSITMRPFLFPEETGIPIERNFIFIGSFGIYLVTVSWAFLENRIPVLIPLSLIGLFMVHRLYRIFVTKILKIEEQIDFDGIHQGPYNLDIIARSIARIFAGLLTVIMLGAAFWNFGPQILIVLTGIFTLFLLGISMYVYKKSL
ncbi:MAG: cation:proton antiporter [Bacillota bacterium]